MSQHNQWSWDVPGQPSNGQEQPAQPDQPQYEQPQYGQYGQPQYGQYGQPQYGQYGSPQPSPLMSEAMKPGIIPLRPLSFGEFFDGAFRAIQHNPQVMFGLSLAVGVVLALAEGLFMGSFVTNWAFGTDPLNPYGTAIPLDNLGLLSGAGIVAGVVSFIATVILNGVLVISVSQSILGRKVTVSAVWQQVKPLFWRLVWLTILVSLLTGAGVILGVGVSVGLITGLALTGSSDSTGLIVTMILLVLAILAAVVLGTWLYVRFSLASPALVLERSTATQALGRSWRLTRGFFWRNFGVLALATIIASAISGVFATPFSFLTSWLSTSGTAGIWLGIVVQMLVTAVLSAITTPFLAAITSLLYVDIRMRTEGLDVELIRAAAH